MELELKRSSSANFITLTYADRNLRPSLDGIPELRKRDMQLFIKRLRKKEANKIKYYACGEYGEKTQRPHYHIILFNLSKTEEQLHDLLVETWQLGNVHIGEVTPASIKYSTGYMVQAKNNWEITPPFALMSKGIGSHYVETHTAWHQADIMRNYVITEGGQKRRLPRYWKNKVYSQKQRDAQALHYITESDRELDKKLYYERNPKGNYYLDLVQKNVRDNNKIKKSLKNNSKL